MRAIQSVKYSVLDAEGVDIEKPPRPLIQAEIYHLQAVENQKKLNEMARKVKIFWDESTQDEASVEDQPK